MLGVQFHPEFKSKPTEPHPLFVEFVKASLLTAQSHPLKKHAAHCSR